ncbi:MAG: GIY-YIG nuclease family protein [Prevotella sp.]|nr:GIY-YIG nuclease family protein [Prevotella sp.]
MAILTVYTKLLDKTLEGARIIDMGSTKSCECFVLPRDKVAEVAKKQSHLTQYGFYILLGRDKNMKPMAYIGQTNDFTNRVNDHKQKKDFWDTALVFVSKSDEIFPSEALYLEYLGWKAAKEAGNYIIENSKDINEPHLSADKQNEMELFFEDIQFLTRFYGCRVFDEPEKPMVAEQGMEFRMKMSTSGMKATMLFFRESKRYVIKAGSTINKTTFNSCSKGIAAFRKEVMENKKLCQIGDPLCTLLQDIEIPETSCSPSGAASFCAGTSFQGTVAWEDKEGKRYPSEWWKEIINN